MKYTIDPGLYGGHAVMLNGAHYPHVNIMDETLDNAYHWAGAPQEPLCRCFLRATRDTQPCTEMFWDYGAVTTNPRDPLLRQKCWCCGRPLVRLVRRSD
jgi:hypothetical protein